MQQLSALMPKILTIARLAGQASLEFYQSDADLAIATKTDHSPVTAADLAAHNIIVTELAKLTPDIPVLSEEAPDIAYDKRRQWDQYWLVDPLDGTREFISGKGEFTVNIALIEQHKAVLGVIFAPISKRIYYAARNLGVYKQSMEHEPEPIHARTCDRDEIIVVASLRNGKIALTNFLQLFPNYELAKASSALKFCLVAEGRADLYPRFSPTSEWDSAAGQCIIEQAGGKVMGLDLQPLPYNTKESLTNPYFIALGDPAIIDNKFKQNLKSCLM